MDRRISSWLPNSFFRSPYWRVLRALYLLDTGRAADPAIDDAWVEVAKDLLSAVESNDLDDVPPAVRAAYGVWTADEMPRWLLEAQLLTSRTFEEVAAGCTLSEPTVLAFHQLFFDVRSRFQASDWILCRAVRSNLLNDFAGQQPAGLWKFFAYAGGPEVLDVVVAVTLKRPLPERLRVQFNGDPHVAEQRLLFKAKLAIAALTAKSSAQLGSVVDLAEQLRGLDQEAGVPINDAHSLPAVVSELFAMLTRSHHAEDEAADPVRAPNPATVGRRARPNHYPAENRERRRS